MELNQDYTHKKRKLHGAQMFTMLFALFLMIVGVTVGVTYSAFQSTATSSGTLTFAVNGHKGQISVSNCDVRYDTSTLTNSFIILPDANYSVPSIISTYILTTEPTASNWANAPTGWTLNNTITTYSAGTITVNDLAMITANAKAIYISGECVASTYTVTISRNNTSYGTVSQASITGVPYGSAITTSGNTLTVNGSTITATPTKASGYTTVFSGWAIPSGKITGNTTITANFTRTANLVISLDNQSADTTGTISVIPTGSTLPNITVPTKSGCLFGGYYTSQYGAGTKYYNANGTPATTWSGSSNITLYAKWMSYIELTSSTNNVSLSTNNNAKNWDGTLEYRLSTPTNSTTWTTWDGTTTIGGSTHTIYLRGTGNTYLTGGSYSSASRYWVIGCASNDVACNGNIMSLLDCTKAPLGASITMGTYAFAYLFNNCDKLVSAPELPATTLAAHCYEYMFYGCSSLTIAPDLPATTLAQNCYYYMFYNCSSLTAAPALPAATLADSCYYMMFYGCSSLTTAPMLPATTLATSCYSNMFYGCTSLTAAPALPVTTLAERCYYGMFYGCTNLVSAPATLPATTLANSCYNGMFRNCSSLTTAPTLPATTLANYCYSYMFSGCSSLVTAPALPATTLADYCYSNMFPYCTNLTTAPALPATTLAIYCYQYMFQSCSSLTTAPMLPATTLAMYCYSNMFRDCISLTTAPTLPATTLADYCYNYMFYNCSKIKLSTTRTGEYQNAYRVPFFGTGTDATSALDSMFSFIGTPDINTTYYTANDIVGVEIEGCIHFSSANQFCIISNSGKNWDGTLEYSTDRTSWSTWDGSVINGTSIYLRGTGNTFITGGYYTHKWLLLGSNIVCSGNIENLLDYNAVALGNHPSMYPYCFAYMFSGCTNLITAPSLPATTLTAYCYYQMFYGCTSLTTAPALPATTLADYCYYQMFYGCSSLTTAPALPATTLASNCYQYMFYGCTKLEVIPSLAHVTTWATSCCSNMFRGCTKVKVSNSNIDAYTTPLLTTGSDTSYFSSMFASTGGTFVGSPAENTTYYTSNEVVLPPKAITFHYYSGYSERPFSSYRWSDENSDSSGDIIDGVTYYVKSGDYHLYKTAACDVYLEYAIIAGKSVDWITLYDGTNNSIGGDSGHKDGNSYSFIPHEDSIDWYSLDLTDIYVSAFDN